jgi:anti-sigma B factor antagonist
MEVFTLPRFNLEIVPERARVTLRVAGELDIATVAELEDAVAELRASGWTAITLDLAEVAFIDSTGLALLLRLARSAGAEGGAIAIGASCPALERLVAVSKLEQALPRG